MEEKCYGSHVRRQMKGMAIYMRKRVLSLLLALILCAGLPAPATAASKEAESAAQQLYELGLFHGVGKNSDGTPGFELDRSLSREEAVTLLVRLLGKEEEVLAGKWDMPFTDVSGWAKPYVGYAYENGLTRGISSKKFSGSSPVSAAQFLTFILRALGYSSGSDFEWRKAWELTDELGITSGEYSAGSDFKRGDAALVAVNALSATFKDGSKTLLAAVEEAGIKAPYPGPASGYSTVSGSTYVYADTAGYISDSGYTYVYGDVTISVQVVSSREAVIAWDVHGGWESGAELYYLFGLGEDSEEDGYAFMVVHDQELYLSEVYARADAYIENDITSAVVEYSQDAERGSITMRVRLPSDSALDFYVMKDWTYTSMFLFT